MNATTTNSILGTSSGVGIMTNSRSQNLQSIANARETMSNAGKSERHNSSVATTSVSAASSVRVRKPYTITKRRESWTEDEHKKFIQALELYHRDWKKIENYVGTKSVIQIRSHAQKYFLKVQRNGTGEHVPPPRPKKKSAKPYPKAPQPPGTSINALAKAISAIDAAASTAVTGSMTTTMKDTDAVAYHLKTGNFKDESGNFPQQISDPKENGKFLSNGAADFGRKDKKKKNRLNAANMHMIHVDKTRTNKFGKESNVNHLRTQSGMAAETVGAEQQIPENYQASQMKGAYSNSNYNINGVSMDMKKGTEMMFHQDDVINVMNTDFITHGQQAIYQYQQHSHNVMRNQKTDDANIQLSPQYKMDNGQAQPDETKTPNFAVVYKYLSTLFEPASNVGRIENLVAVSPVDRQTIVLLMENLTANLQSPQIWNEQVRLLSQGLPNLVLEVKP